MSLPPNGCTAMIRPYRCWPKARLILGDVRDDRPFGGTGPPAAMFYYSRDRAGEHPQAHLANYAGIFQADAYGGYNRLYEPDRKPGPILEAVRRIDALFEIERSINGQSAEQRRTLKYVAEKLGEDEEWLRDLQIDM